jgi:hypothetical protein
MSKRHTASRRRTYGRRQHELHERIDRVTGHRQAERAWRAEHATAAEPRPYPEGAVAPLRFGFID